MTDAQRVPTQVWDLPTRLFHWMLVACVAGAWLSSRSDRWLAVHVFLGEAMLGLLSFRLVWGVVGGRWARFSSFVTGPRAVRDYLRDMLHHREAASLGHNPAAGVAILAMMALGAAVGVTGLFTQGGEERQGPAAGSGLGIAAGTALKEAHWLLAVAMAVVIAGHLAGVALASWRHRENLPLSMVTGRKLAPAGTVPSQTFPVVGALLALAVAGFAAQWFGYAWQRPLPARPAAAVAFVGRPAADDPLWRTECGGCHLAFPAHLLPERAWRRLLAGQADHFGTDLALDAQTLLALQAFLVPNAAERSATEAAAKIDRSIPAATTPLRITETPYWVAKHAGIAEADWRGPAVGRRSNCGACHRDAAAGGFEDAAMRMPVRRAPSAAAGKPPG